MPHFKYSKVARLELLDIIEYTRNLWGDAQARSYLDSLENTLDLLAQYPLAGRSFSAARPNWRRFEHASHIILYRPIPTGVRIQRILHKHQLIDPRLH